MRGNVDDLKTLNRFYILSENNYNPHIFCDSFIKLNV